ncbi:hypothetical protein CALVIDRAFT_602590 [Calocera viscosa TUFC12733]|uniref:Clavaminate synthase-like protein n=1 Tax=Calocera viscosa (strain TUFC12733) TaxID=1330018 RepID=A0A167GWE1_CALVF|nr:hypothetical protein CALVIDRAFT_602590 [Calocera viscosa TUFC12733]
MPIQYRHLTPPERSHFLTHHWLHLPSAIRPRALDYLLEGFWERLGADPEDKSTWPGYVKLPRHREVPIASEVVGGAERIDPIRERYQGDQFIWNGGNEGPNSAAFPNSAKTTDPRLFPGWHTDNDWYRQTIFSSGNSLTLIILFSDVVSGGGVLEWVKLNGEQDPPFEKTGIYAHAPKCSTFTEITGKKGDVFVTHGLLSLVEQVILNAMGVERYPTPNWNENNPQAPGSPTVYFPHAARAKVALVPDELDRLAKVKGGMDNVQSPWKARKGAEGTGTFNVDTDGEIAKMDRLPSPKDDKEKTEREERKAFLRFIRRNGWDRQWSAGARREEEGRAKKVGGVVGGWMWRAEA